MEANISTKQLMRASRRLSYLLRHQKENPPIDKNGFALVKDILSELKINKDKLDYIVQNNDKKRFEYSKDNLKIRACQGHTIDVDVDLVEAKPPVYLYHGTSTKSISSIMDSGILKMKRLYVHLIEDIEIAKSNGSRFGSPCVILVNAEEMYENGIKFYKSKNNVWLTDKVESKYFLDIIYF